MAAFAGAAAGLCSPALPPPPAPVQVVVTNIVGPQPVSPLDLEKQLTEFSETIRADAKQHEDRLASDARNHEQFLEKEYDHVTHWIEALSAIVAVVFGFLSWKSLREQRKATAEAIEDTKRVVDRELKKTLANSEDQIRAAVQARVDKLKTELQEKVDDFEKEFSGLIDMVAKLAAPLARAVVILQPSLPVTAAWKAECNSLRMILADLQKIDPANRTIAIFIGRLFKAVGNLDGAIKSLQEVIQKRTNSGKDTGKDQGDLYFNLACYLHLRAGKETDADPKNALRDKAWAALKASAERWPPNWREAQGDDELKSLADDNHRWSDIEPTTAQDTRD
jgi:tetratricopeptide (TPR) repeat protein